MAMSKNQKWLLVAVAIIALVGVLWYQGYSIQTPSGDTIGKPTATPTATNITPQGSIPLTLNVPFYMFNGTNVAASAASPQAILLRADRSTIIGISASGAAITGNLNPVDNGVAYLLVAPSATGTYGQLDNMIASANAGVIASKQGVMMFQGNPWTCFQLNLANLQQISTGVTTSINLYGYMSETPAITSYINGTAIGSASTGSAVSTAYFNGFVGNLYGQGYKITRMQVAFSVAANATAYDSGEFQLSSVDINMGNGVTMTTSNIQWMGTSAAYIEVGSPTTQYLAGTTSVNQQINGLPVLVGQADSPSSTMQIVTHWTGKQATAGDSLLFTLKVFYVTPAGTVGTASQTGMLVS